MTLIENIFAVLKHSLTSAMKLWIICIQASSTAKRWCKRKLIKHSWFSNSSCSFLVAMLREPILFWCLCSLFSAQCPPFSVHCTARWMGDRSQHLTLVGKISRGVDFDKSAILSLCWRVPLQNSWFVIVTRTLFNFFSKTWKIKHHQHFSE